MRTGIVVFAALLTQACVATSYHKIVTVHKDAEGRVTEIVVVEELTQPNRSEEPIQFKYMSE
jgi:hypothetical protein